MADARLDELRRRVQKDPASIAFAQLAEELRRAGQFHEAVDVCRTGLAIHPSYLSARVTLGRALIDLKRIDEAQQELEQVRRLAPENLAAIRALADIHRLGGRTFDSSPVDMPEVAAEEATGKPEPIPVVAPVQPPAPLVTAIAAEPPAAIAEPAILAEEPTAVVAEPVVRSAEPAVLEAPQTTLHVQDTRTLRTIAALEHWLDAIHVARARRSA